MLKEARDKISQQKCIPAQKSHHRSKAGKQSCQKTAGELWYILSTPGTSHETNILRGVLNLF